MYTIIISWTQPYPKYVTYRIKASNFAVASSYALKRWRKEEVKGKRIQSVRLECVKIPSVSTND